MATTLGDGIRLAVEKLQALNDSIPSVVLDGVTYTIKRWPVKYPPTLETQFLPCTLIFQQQGVTVAYADTKQTQRDFKISTYVDPTAQGKFDNPIQVSYLFLQRYLEMYLDLISSSQDNMILDYGATSQYRIELLPYQINMINDTGVVSYMKYTGDEPLYFGFEFTVKVQIEWPKNC